ncbi:MAG: nucleotidyltransferase family protein [Rubrobacter sp.]
MTQASVSRGESSIAAVLLAAGAGSRFGGERGEKLLADFRGRPLVLHAMQTLYASPVEGVFVVVEDASGKVASLCAEHGFRVVENRAAREGQATSVAAGLRAVEDHGGFGAALVMLGDQPLVGEEVVRRIVGAFRDGAKVAVATYSGKPRNPVLFSHGVWDDLKHEMTGDEGARSFLRSRRDLIVEVECGDVGSPADVDTRDDLEGLEADPDAGSETQKRRSS